MNFYYEAAKSLERLDAKKGSIRSIIGCLPESSRKRCTALITETLKYKDALTSIITSSSLLKHERKHLSSNYLALLLVHDLLFTRGGIQASDGPTKQAIMRHKTRLQAELAKLKVKRGAKSNLELALRGDSRASQIPRYVRVNTTRWTTEDAADYFTSKGFSKSSSPFANQTGFILDEHVSNLLAFHPNVTFHDDPAYHDGRIILQDKASCFPALVLSPDSHVRSVTLDATAAPGNKTTHLSAIMQNRGRILAFEKDRLRFRTLETMVSLAGCKNVEIFNADFLSIDPLDGMYAEVSHILLDPSCSGSGIVNRLDYLLDSEHPDEDEEGRLSRLSAFQLAMIKHAMKFPRVIKIVYSTCSIHAAENEHVAARALASEEARLGAFTLAPRSQVISAWKRRGLAEEMGPYSALAESLIRCNPGEDRTNGFFVSCFVRKSSLPTGEGSSSIQDFKRKLEADLGDGSSSESTERANGDKRRKGDGNEIREEAGPGAADTGSRHRRKKKRKRKRKID